LLSVLAGDLLERLLLTGQHTANQFDFESVFSLGHTDDSPLAINRFTESWSLSKNRQQRRELGLGQMIMLQSRLVLENWLLEPKH
jgi:hypothetical protein